MDPNDQLKMGQPVTVNVPLALARKPMIDSSKAVVQAHNLFMTLKFENKNSADISAIVDLNMQIKKRRILPL